MLLKCAYFREFYSKTDLGLTKFSILIRSNYAELAPPQNEGGHLPQMPHPGSAIAHSHHFLTSKAPTEYIIHVIAKPTHLVCTYCSVLCNYPIVRNDYYGSGHCDIQWVIAFQCHADHQPHTTLDVLRRLLQ